MLKKRVAVPEAQGVDASDVQDLTPGLTPCRTTGATTATRSAKAHAMLLSEEGSPLNYKLNCPAWHKPYAEALLEANLERLVTIWAATEVAVIQRLLELAADQDASGVFCAQVFRPVEKRADRRTLSLAKPR